MLIPSKCIDNLLLSSTGSLCHHNWTPAPEAPNHHTSFQKKTRQLLRKIKKNKFDASLKKKRNIIAKKNKNKNEV
jgi:hypothetical protein